MTQSKEIHTNLDLETYQKIKSRGWKIPMLLRIAVEHIDNREKAEESLQTEAKNLSVRFEDILDSKVKLVEEVLDKIGILENRIASTQLIIEKVDPNYPAQVNGEIKKTNERIDSLEEQLASIRSELQQLRNELQNELKDIKETIELMKKIRTKEGESPVTLIENRGIGFH